MIRNYLGFPRGISGCASRSAREPRPSELSRLAHLVGT